jgi:SAM-dependent methyltransferase
VGIRWQAKALIQGCFSLVPGGERLNYLFQRFVTHSLPSGDKSFLDRVTLARQHAAFLSRYGRRPLSAAKLYEFGAGWELSIPLVYWTLGAERQVLVDIRVLVRPSLVNNNIQRCPRLQSQLNLPRLPGGPLPTTAAFHSALRERFGIEYIAPCDARATGLPAGSVDYITSTNTLEHVPRDDIKSILVECHRLLADGGVMSFRIDYQDHYSYFDNHLSPYNFLQYSERQWARYNPALHFQNRMRHRDYLELFDQTGFEILEEAREDGGPADLRLLQELKLGKCFRTYAPEDLAVRAACTVLRKPVGAAN